MKNFADNRLIRGCIYCNGLPDTRDHVPSKCLLEKPYPENLPVVGCCYSCNQGFSKDEQYFICLLECVLCGSTDLEKIERLSVRRMLENTPSLRKRIENSKTKVNGQIVFIPEMERINNVMLKLAQGHCAFELGQSFNAEPIHFWSGPLLILSQEEQENFNAAHFPQFFGEVGSRNMQRLQVIQISKLDENGKEQITEMIFNDWIEVQKDRYRYLAIEELGQIVIRIVISEYYACEVAWNI